MNTTLRDKRKEWIKALCGTDRHAIHLQLTGMAWDTAVYEVVNQARRFAPRDSAGRVQLNGMVYALFDKGFFTSQVAAIRRLADESPFVNSANEKKDRSVWSITALLKDLKQHQALLTRSAIFTAEDLIYAHEPHEKRWVECLSHEHQTGQYPQICQMAT